MIVVAWPPWLPGIRARLESLLHRNHTDAFWNEMDKVMPDDRKRKTWLRKHRAGLDA